MTGRIFLKLIAGVICLLLLAAVSVDYFATEVTRNPRGFSFLAIGLLMASWPLYLMIRDGQAVATALKEMLRM